MCSHIYRFPINIDLYDTVCKQFFGHLSIAITLNSNTQSGSLTLVAERVIRVDIDPMYITRLLFYILIHRLS